MICCALLLLSITAHRCLPAYPPANLPIRQSAFTALLPALLPVLHCLLCMPPVLLHCRRPAGPRGRLRRPAARHLPDTAAHAGGWACGVAGEGGWGGMDGCAEEPGVAALRSRSPGLVGLPAFIHRSSSPGAIHACLSTRHTCMLTCCTVPTHLPLKRAGGQPAAAPGEDHCRLPHPHEPAAGLQHLPAPRLHRAGQPPVPVGGWWRWGGGAGGRAVGAVLGGGVKVVGGQACVCMYGRREPSSVPGRLAPACQPASASGRERVGEWRVSASPALHSALTRHSL